MLPMPVTKPSAGVLAIRSSSLRRLRCAATASAPYSRNEPSSQRSAIFSRAVRRPRAWRLATASGRCASSVGSCRPVTRFRSGRWPRGACAPGFPSARATSAASMPAPAPAFTCVNNAPASTRSPGAKNISPRYPSTSARTSCSIFMASRTTRRSPARTAAPGSTCQ